MNISEHISSGLFESYVLGLATEEENRLVHDLLLLHPDLKGEIIAIEESLLLHASGQIVAPPSKIKEDVFQEPEPNPYDSIQRDDTAVSQIPIDSLNITYVHSKVLATRCALPGCHVGVFQPDF